MSRPTVIRPGYAWSPGSLRDLVRDTRPESRALQGKILVVAGWVVALVGIVVYSVATFASEVDVDLAAIVVHGANPAARTGLIVIGVGSLMWLVGSVRHLNGVMDGEPGGDPGP